MQSSPMEVLLESSSLFFNKHTGIPRYIDNLYEAMVALEGVDPILAYHLKKIKKGKDLPEKYKDKNHIWHWNRVAFGLKNSCKIAHSLHTPFLNLKSCKKVATVHDMAVHLDQFKAYNFASEYFQNKRFQLFKNFTKHADAIITVSEVTKRDFLSFFNFPEENIHVVPLAPSKRHEVLTPEEELLLLQKLGLNNQPYFLSVGGISLRKNSFNLIKGYHLSASRKQHKLVIVGKIEDNHKEEVYQYIQKHHLENDIIITKYIDDRDLHSLYKNASAFLFPTFYEGFGIPIIEALMHQLPVITSTTGAAPETSGGHTILVNPFEPESIAVGIDKSGVWTEQQRITAKEYAETFTWRETARKTVAVYKKLM